eukprot:5151496-Prymnesium_polylepis.1
MHGRSNVIVAASKGEIELEIECEVIGGNECFRGVVSSNVRSPALDLPCRRRRGMPSLAACLRRRRL